MTFIARSVFARFIAWTMIANANATGTTMMRVEPLTPADLIRRAEKRDTLKWAIYWCVLGALLDSSATLLVMAMWGMR